MELFDEPALIYLCFAVATVLLIVEAALPTLGAAGSVALVAAVVGTVGLAEEDLDWWPLLLVGLAIVLWAIMLARRSTSLVEQVAAAVLFVVGSLGFGILAEDPPTIVVALLASAGVVFAFPVLFARAVRLLGGPPEIGLEAVGGHTAVVTEWHGAEGTVRFEGSLWRARAGGPLTPGSTVVIRRAEGLTLFVEAAPGGDATKAWPNPGRGPTWRS